MARSKTQLQAIFDLYNRRYFGNKLTNVIVKWAKSPFIRNKVSLMGYTTTSIYANKTLKHVIEISETYKTHANVAQMTLLHEMCHVKLHQQGDYRTHHGPKFQEEMLRLAKIHAFRELW